MAQGDKKREKLKLNSREEVRKERLVVFRTMTYDFEKQIFPRWYIAEKCPDYCIDFHYHDYIEIIKVKKGKMRLKTSVMEKLLFENDIYIVNRNEVHAGWFFNQKCLEYSYVQIDLGMLNVMGNSKTQKKIDEIRLGVWGVRAYIPANTSLNRELSECMDRIEAALYRDRKEAQTEFAQLSACFDLLGTFCRLGLVSKPKTNNLRPQKDISAKALSYIQSHYSEKISTKSFCEKYYYDESQFCRVFKRNFGMSFLEFLNSYRVKMACYSKSDDKTVNMYEIAQQVGFDNYSYFYRQFKKYTGKTPLEYFSAYEV